MRLIKNKTQGYFAAALSLSIACSVVDVIAKETQQTSNFMSSLGRLTFTIVQNSSELQAGQASVNAASARFVGASSPLFNPEVEVESERTKEGEDPVITTKIGISQTIDWHGKGSAGARVANIEMQLRDKEVESKRLQIFGEIVRTLVRYKSAQEINMLTQRKVDLLRKVSQFSEQQRRVGDISEADALLARIALNEAVMEQSSNVAELTEIEGEFKKFGGLLPVQIPDLPITLPPLKAVETDLEQLATKHPEVVVSRLKMDLNAARIEAAESNRGVDPTIGLTIGQQDKKEDKQHIVSLRFSVPLAIRNDFSSNVTAAKHELIQAENDARNTFQKIIGDMDSIRKKYRILYDAWGVWSNSSQGQLDTYLDLLERLRGKGEMSISDYLLQLQQRLDTKVAGQKTHGQVWVTWVTWLTYSGQMEGWLNTAKEEK